jgi:hypothetical protein
LARLLQFEPHGRYGVTVSPEALAAEIPLLAAQAGDGDRALPLENSDYAKIHRDHLFLEPPDFVASVRNLLNLPDFKSILDPY